MAEADWIDVAHLGRSRGLRGQIFADGEQTGEWYRSLPRVRVRLADGRWFEREGAPADLKLVEAANNSGRLVLRFSGIESVEEANLLVNGSVCVNRAERPAPSEGEFWLADLVGCEVSDVRDGRVYGTITGWQDSGGPTVLEMSPVGGGEPVLVPFARSICQKIDVAARRIEIDPPAGLIELNAGPGEAAEESE